MTTTDVTKRSRELLEELAQQLAAGRSDGLEHYLAMLAKFHNYSFGNCMLIAMQCPQATHVAGYRRWLELHRFVRRGEKGIAILAPCVYKRKRDDEAEDDEPQRVVRGFRTVYVFDVSQTDGEPLPELAAPSGDPGQLIEQLEAAIVAHGIQVSYDHLPPLVLGRSEGGRITVSPLVDGARRFCVLCHEFAHELLHKGDRRKDTTKIIRETEAEAVACVDARALGIDSAAASVDYIQLYNGNKQTLLQSLELVQQTADAILLAINVFVCAA